MNFSRISIACCLGDGFVLDGVAEVPMIELQPTAPSNERNRKPTSTEKRKSQSEKRRMAERVEIMIC